MSFEPKIKSVTFRLNKADYKTLEILADIAGMKMSRFMDEKVLKPFFVNVNNKSKKPSF